MTKEELKQEAKEYAKQNYCEMCVMADDCKCGCIDCFTVQAYFASAEPREKQIEILSKHILELQADKGRLTDKVRELEAEVKEWKDKADLWCKTANLKDHNIMINKELEKENARLKEINTHTLSQLNLDNGELILELTKAKELLTRFVMASVYFNGKETDLIEEAEQFLGRVEK